jgi:DUF4097 and DUF4098 domain-containing protein YvlB
MLFATTVLIAALATSPATDTTLAVARGTRLSVNNLAGRIIVTAWNRDEVQVHYTSDDDDAAINVELSGGEIRVSQRMRHGPAEIDLTINAPAWMPLDLQGTETAIIVSGSTAPVRAQSVEGDITLTGGADNVSLNSVEGAVRAEGVRGALDIQAVDGDVTIRDMIGALSIQGVDGSILLESVTSSAVRVSTVAGDVSFTGPIAPNGSYSFTTHDGDLTIRPVGALNATVTVSTWSGDFESAFPVTIRGSQNSKRFTFTQGTGSARIELEAFDGQIRLAR